MLKRNGILDGIIAASTQCVEEPNAWPDARKRFGNISEINTHITAPCPMAWDAIKRKRKTGTHIPPQFKKKAAATRESEII